MKNWLLRWVISAVALAIVANIHIGVTIRESNGSILVPLILSTLVIGLVNSLIRPILVLFTLPITCFTLGLFSYVLNAILFAATQLIVPQFHTTFLGAFIGPILMGLLSSILNNVLTEKDKR